MADNIALTAATVRSEDKGGKHATVHIFDVGGAGAERLLGDSGVGIPIEPLQGAGFAPSSFISDGTAKNGFLKASAGVFYGLQFYNVNANPCRVRLYNMTTAPATSDTPVLRFLIPGNTAGAGNNLLLPIPYYFSTGIAWRITTGAADNDDTVAAANEVSGNWIWK